MKRAVRQVLIGEGGVKLSLHKAATDNGISFQTLQRYVKKEREKANPNIEIPMKSNHKHRLIFNEVEDKALVNYVITSLKCVMKNETVEEIINKYLRYVEKHYAASSYIVFDGYPEIKKSATVTTVPAATSTKRGERNRRKTSDNIPEFDYQNHTKIPFSQEKFLSNEKNKDKIIKSLMKTLQSQGFSCKQVEEDADADIIKTSIEVARDTNKTVIVPRSFHRFPEEPRRTQWSSFLGLEGVDTIGKFVCSDHFTEEDFITKPGSKRYLKFGALPIIHRKPPVRTPPIITFDLPHFGAILSEETVEPASKRHCMDSRVWHSESSVPSTSTSTTSGPIIHSDDELETNGEMVEKIASESKQDVSTQTFTWKEIESLKEQNMELKTELQNLRQKLKRCKCSDTPESKISVFVKDLEGNEKRCVFYTGLIFQQILMLLTFLSPLDDLRYWATNDRANSRRRKFNHLAELVLTLVRLRSGLLVEDLRYRFDISVGSVTKIVTTWVQHMYIKFDSLRPMMFCSREKIKENLPAIFSGLKNIRVIIDCAEFICHSPIDFEEKSNCYSSYSASQKSPPPLVSFERVYL
ncbi:hypothetical protein JTB14_005149 [Gonioctena quinquepunctata]|nr:hypothetical protein JTB14_005149 [Gonioctena quinquepunctata]